MVNSVSTFGGVATGSPGMTSSFIRGVGIPPHALSVPCSRCPVVRCVRCPLCAGCPLCRDSSTCPWCPVFRVPGWTP
eukprot:12980606-Alexandrium_andersonii.AAC.1